MPPSFSPPLEPLEDVLPLLDSPLLLDDEELLVLPLLDSPPLLDDGGGSVKFWLDSSLGPSRSVDAAPEHAASRIAKGENHRDRRPMTAVLHARCHLPGPL